VISIFFIFFSVEKKNIKRKKVKKKGCGEKEKKIVKTNWKSK
jgi:hypothetical protein